MTPKMISKAFVLLICLQVVICLIHKPFGRMRHPSRASSSLKMGGNGKDTEVEFKVVSMNILAPCYRKVNALGSGEEDKAYLEKEDPEMYISRNGQIIDQLIDSSADVICLQEFWSSNEELQNLYVERLCEDEDYTMKTLPRTSHWRKRDDGLAVFVKEERVFIQDYRDILFHDCGDRVAQMLLLAMRPDVEWGLDDEDEEEEEMPLQQFICVNTHLLFPHNEYSSKIRMREATKILGFVESYRQRELCRSICSRSSVRLPVIVTGDFNGSPKGRVYNLMRSQNYDSVFARDEYTSLVTHLSHRNEAINVDHIFYQNPSAQTEDSLVTIPVPDWTNLVFRELKEKIIARYGIGNFYEAFRSFDSDESDYISKEEFSAAIRQLGFGSEGQPALTSDEIEVLVDSADKDGDGQIDFKEFCTRFWMADNNLDNSDVDFAEQWGEGGAGDEDCTTGSGSTKTGGGETEAKSTWLAQGGGTLAQGEQGAGAAAGMDNKWGDSSTAVAVAAVSATADVEKERRRASNAESRRTSIIFFEGDDAPGIWGEYSTELTTAQSRIQMLPDSTPLGDMRVKSMAVTPETLSTGLWPQGYSISDHGMVEAVFAGKCLRKEENEETEG